MRALFCGMLLLLALTLPGEAAPGDALVVQGSEANLRRFPSLKAEVLTTLRRGSRLVEVSRDGDWVRVRIAQSDGLQGYVHRSLVQSAAPSDSAAEPQPADASVLRLSREQSRKLDQVLREIDQLKQEVSDLRNRLIRIEGKVDRLRR